MKNNKCINLVKKSKKHKVMCGHTKDWHIRGKCRANEGRCECREFIGEGSIYFHKRIKKPTIVKFTNKEGETLKIKATKIITKPIKVDFLRRKDEGSN